MELLLIVGVIGVIPGAIAAAKGRSFVGWWLYGALLFIVALPHALLIRTDRQGLDHKALSDGSLKRCEHCAELIRREARVCRYCGRDVGQPAATRSAAADYLG